MNRALDPVVGENRIVWLTNPLKFRYLRESNYLTTRREGRIRRPHSGVLIGYATHWKYGRGVQAYIRRYWWLKNHDRDLDPEGTYGRDTFERGPAPTEAVVPTSVRVGIESKRYSSSDLALEDLIHRWPKESKAAGLTK